MRLFVRIIFVVTFTAGASGSVLGNTPIITQQALLDPYTAQAVESIDDVLASRAWTPYATTIAEGYLSSPRWVKFSLSPHSGNMVFALTNPWLFAIDLYLVAQGKVVRKIETGSTRPLRNRDIAATAYAIVVPAEVDTIYVNDFGESTANYPATFTPATDFSHAKTGNTLFLGLYYGAMLFIIAFALILYQQLRDAAYLFYALIGSALIVLLSAADGSWVFWFPLEAPVVPHFLASFGWALTIVGQLNFARCFLGLSGKWLWPHWVVQSIALVTAVLAVAFPSPAAYAWMTLASSLNFVTILWQASIISRTGSRPAQLFLAAYCVFTIGSIFHIAMLMGLLPSSFLVHHSIHIASIIELGVLAIGLAYRIRIENRDRRTALQRNEQLARRNKELRLARNLAEEHRQLQKSLQQAQKLKTIGQMAGGFAHDFNNILASILGFAELAQTPAAQADRSKMMRYLNEIQNSGERGASLVKQLLIYSRSTPAEHRDVSLKELLADVFELLRGSLPATVSLHVADLDSALRITCDREQLQQVFVNLCLNAAEMTQNRGAINLSVESVDLEGTPCSSCMTNLRGHFVAVRVEDDGPGIQGNPSDLFTPFYTTKEVGEGTGLGLSVVHGIVHEHKGHVRAVNRVDGGARFTVYLPTAENIVALPTQKQQHRILVIEDEASVAAYLSALLEAEEFVTHTMQLPTQVLGTFVNDPDAYDLVITDHLMPQTTGLEVAEDLHALRPDLPIILVTGNAMDVAREELLASGVSAVFQKPLNSEQLLAKIRGLLAI